MKIRLRFAIPLISFSALALLATTAALGIFAPPTAEPQAKLTRHPYVQLATPDSIVVVWRTLGPSIPTVRVGTRPDSLDRTLPPGRITMKLAQNVPGLNGTLRLHSAPDNTHQYEAHVGGLKPDSRYYYAVYDGEERLAGGDSEHYLQTLPDPGKARPLRFWVIGDSGTGLLPQRQVFDAMRAFVTADRRPLDGFLHLGDIAYSAGTEPEFQARVFEIYSSLLRNTVVWPSMGNHEGATSRGTTGIGPYYDAFVLPTRGEAGGLPSGKEAFYSFDFANVHFICLDSHDLSRKPDGEMAVWLRADLERTKADWIVAYWHHPPYTKGTHDSDTEIQLVEMRTHIMPILESGGVDLVLSGHSHIYERSMLIDGAYVTPTTTDGVVLDDGDGKPDGDGPYRKSAGLQPHRGTVAVVAGTGGTGVGRSGTMPIMRSVFVENGSVILDVAGDTLTGIMLNLHGEIRDRFQIVKRGEVAVAIVKYPWTAFGPRIEAPESEFAEPILVTIAARPPAPDARIHFTTDGSEPTLRSPVYHAPIVIAETTNLKTFSTWRGGERISPVSTHEFRRLPPAVFMRRILRSEDDIEENAAGRILPEQTRLELGRFGQQGQLVGLRFTRIAVPRGARIKSAYVQFACRIVNTEPANLRVFVPRVGDISPFGTARFSLSRLITDAPYVDWVPRNWETIAEMDRPQQTPNLAGLLQQVIDHPHWDPGQAIAVVIAGEGSRIAASFDRSPPHAPFLMIEVER